MTEVTGLRRTNNMNKKFPIPKTKDPFINAPVIYAGSNKDKKQRFWISSWNNVAGSAGVLFDEDGGFKIHRFERKDGNVGCGAYSEVYTRDNKLILCSDLRYLTLFDPDTGACEYIETGVDKKGLVFNGMTYDEKTGKLFGGANFKGKLVCFSYDLINRRNIKIYEDFTEACLIRGSFKNRDDSFTFRMITGKSALYRWDPLKEALNEVCKIDPGASVLNTITVKGSSVYIPYEGWLNTDSFIFEKGPLPKIEGEWFGLADNYAYGLSATASGAFNSMEGSTVLKWNLETGETEKLYDVGELCFAKMTDKGDIVIFTMYGEFIKISGEGELLVRKDFDICSAGSIDCLVKVDDRRIIGTPFISQRFWMLDTEDDLARDCGRAGPGIGQVARAECIGDKIYFATYNRGVLTEYDPQKPVEFPVNPAVLAYSPLALRPVAHTTGDKTYYYSCDFHYGKLGCIIIKYDTVSKSALYNEDPLEKQHITDMEYIKEHKMIAALSGSRADAGVTSTGPDICYMLALDSETTEVLSKHQLDKDFSDPAFLCRVSEDEFIVKDLNKPVYAICNYRLNKSFVFYGPKDVRSGICSPEKNVSVFLKNDEVILCEFKDNEFKRKKTIFSDPGIYRIMVSKDLVFAVTPDYIYIYNSATEGSGCE